MTGKYRDCMEWLRGLAGELPVGVKFSDTFTEQYIDNKKGHRVPNFTKIGGVDEWITRTVAYINIPQDRALAWLSMKINAPEDDDPHSFLDYTAKELSIKMAFEMEEEAAAAFFKKLEEPLASRVLHYLLKLGAGPRR